MVGHIGILAVTHREHWAWHLAVSDRPGDLDRLEPAQDWVAVESCACDGFFVLRRGLHDRLPILIESERHGLATRI